MSHAILGIDAVSEVCSVGLYTSAQELNVYTSESHSSNRSVLELVERVLGEDRLLDVIVVISGPGTYSGLRIGISSTYGLALGLNCPTAAVTTFEAITEAIRGKFESAILVHPLGRKNFAVQKLKDQQLEGTVEIVKSEALYKFQDEGHLLVGEGCSVFGGYAVDAKDRLRAVLQSFDVSRASHTDVEAWYLTEPKITSPKIPFPTGAQRPLAPR